MRRPLLALLVVVLTMPACSSSGSKATPTSTGPTPVTSAPPTTATTASTLPSTVSPTSSVAATSTSTTVTSTSVIAPDPSRPFDVVVPPSYKAGSAMALVVLLHGYGFDGATQSAYFGIQTEAERRGFLLVHPDGTKNALGKRFWNATDACCGYDSTVDDVAYVTAVIDDVSANYTVDPKRVFVIGHSNGGFMSYRMACDRAGRIAAIASLAGATFDDTSKCNPSEPVSVLQVHGTADNTIEYQGGEILGNRYPSAEQTVADWAAYNACSATATTGDAPVDLLPAIDGAETTTKSYPGCPPGIGVELWSMDGAGHVPIPATTMVSAMLDFLFAHPKP